jgi:ABC-2 type transport system permease protein
VTAFRYAKASLRVSMQTAWVYRADLLLEVLVELFYVGTALAPLFAVFHRMDEVSGWKVGDAVAVAGVFTMLQGFMEAIISPSLLQVIEQVQKGTFDFVMLRPIDAQLGASLSRFSPFKLVNLVAGAAMVLYGVPFRTWTIAGALVFFAFLFGGALILYSLWLIAVSCTFRFGRLENLPYFIVAWFDAARWPRFVYRGALKIMFTFIFPLAIMTSYPVLALRGMLLPSELALGFVWPMVFLGLARMVWLRALRHYTSGS